MDCAAEMLGAALLVFAMQPTLTAATEVRVADEDLRLRDVVNPGSLPPAVQSRIGSRVVARLPLRNRTIMSRAGVAALVRRAVPGLNLAAPSPGTVTLIRASRPVAPIRTCYTASHDIAAGAVVDAKALTSAPCESGRAAGLVYDRARGRVISRAAVHAGSSLGALMLPSAPTVQLGDRLALTSAVGPVVVERAVTAMQPGRVGHRVFVRDGTDQIFTVAIGAMR